MLFDIESVETLKTVVVESLPAITAGAGVFLLFWIGGMILQRIVIRMGSIRGIDADLSRFLGRVARVTMMIVGGVMALGTAGVEVGALVAGLGLTGFALGFALKDIVSNVVAGILIIVYRPFQQGDQIAVSSFQGTVSAIDLRYTLLSVEQKRVFVPNSMLFSNAITVEQPG